jgi:hypothetical protein
MTTIQAKESLDRLFKQAIQNSFQGSTDDVVEVVVVSDDDIDKSNQTQIVVITISSYTFRFICLLYCEPTDSTKQYLARYYKKESNDIDSDSLREFSAELTNMTCGKFNRDLVEYFAHVGMSTPNFIEYRSISHFNKLHLSHVKHFKVEINQAIRFHFSLFVSDYANLDFKANFAKEDDVESGELELF